MHILYELKMCAVVEVRRVYRPNFVLCGTCLYRLL